MSKVGRNDPCPCGSGKKYKKCCANKALGARKVTMQSGNMMSRISGLTGSIQPQSLSGRVKSLSDRVSSSAKDAPKIAPPEALKKDESKD